MRRGGALPVHERVAPPEHLAGSCVLLRHQRWGLPLGFGLSVLFHGAYDLLLSRPEIPSFTSSLLILALWIWVLIMAPRLAARAQQQPQASTPGVAAGGTGA